MQTSTSEAQGRVKCTAVRIGGGGGRAGRRSRAGTQPPAAAQALPCLRRAAAGGAGTGAWAPSRRPFSGSFLFDPGRCAVCAGGTST